MRHSIAGRKLSRTTGHRRALYRNLGSGTFEDITERSGVAGAFSGKGQWASALFDFDNDGDLDIFSANGTAEELILDAAAFLADNDSYHYFEAIGDLLLTGPTNTNVNDLAFVFAF